VRIGGQKERALPVAWRHWHTSELDQEERTRHTETVLAQILPGVEQVIEALVEGVAGAEEPPTLYSGSQGV
jgi:hypothetical protein